MLPLIPLVGPSPSTKKLVMLLSPSDDEPLSSTLKINTFLAKLHETNPSNAISWLFY